MADLNDRDLVRLYWPFELRPAFDALTAIDDALADIVASASQPALGAIRLAWWREALERLDTSPPPPEPRLQAVAAALFTRGISGAELARLEAGWAALLDEQPDPDAVSEGGATLFSLGARLLGSDDGQLAAAGRLYALVRTGMVDQAREVRRALSAHRFAKPLRPLTALARLAARDLARHPGREPQGTPGRALALIAHRLSGVVA